MKDYLQKMFDQNRVTFGSLSPDKIMALTIYAEARGEPREGKIAVGSVILERVDHRAWDGTNITDVCLWPYQFSCFLQGDPNLSMLKSIALNWHNEIINNPVLNECWNIAVDLILGKLPRDIKIAEAHACQYLTTAAKANTEWWKSMQFVEKVGAQEFYA